MTFIAPALPLKLRHGVQYPVSSRPTRLQPTLSLKFPNGNSKPFGPSSGVNLSKFFSFGSRSSFGFFDGFGGDISGGGSGQGRGRSDGSGGGSASDDANTNIFIKLWGMYNSRLDRSPITTKAITSLIGFLLGDVIAQKFLGDEKSSLDWARVARMASFGFLIHGPTGHYFYSALDRLIVGTSPVKVASKVAIDQVLWAPVFTALFFSYLGFAEGKSLDDVIKKIKNDTWIGVKTSWKFWPLAHAVNFGFVPTSQRLLYINTLQVGYNVILSIIGNK